MHTRKRMLAFYVSKCNTTFRAIFSTNIETLHSLEGGGSSVSGLDAEHVSCGGSVFREFLFILEAAFHINVLRIET